MAKRTARTRFLPWIAPALLACLMGCSSGSNEFQPARGWILLQAGSISDIHEAIAEYDGLTQEIVPGNFRAELHLQADGRVAVLFPDGLPAYDLANMTGWLNEPPDQPGVHGATAWLTSPSTLDRYSLHPEAENAWGDTLVGSSSKGQSVRIYLPDAGMSAISRSIPYTSEPAIDLSGTPVRIDMTLDTNPEFGNPGFTINAPADHDWQP